MSRLVVASTGVALTAATNVFVGVTRPRELLALAVRKSHSVAFVGPAQEQGWKLVDLVTRAQNEVAAESSLANSNPNPTISGLEKLPGFANFILGEDSSQWHTEVPTFNGVIYHSVYQGIDRIFKGKEGQLKSEFLVAAFADPSQIKMNYTGVNDIRLRDDGALILETPLGELIDNAPIVYQDINGQRVNVPAAYNLLGNGQVGFSLGDFDRTEPLVIDPVLAYSTYLGGSTSDT